MREEFDSWRRMDGKDPVDWEVEDFEAFRSWARDCLCDDSYKAWRDSLAGELPDDNNIPELPELHSFNHRLQADGGDPIDEEEYEAFLEWRMLRGWGGSTVGGSTVDDLESLVEDDYSYWMADYDGRERWLESLVEDEWEPTDAQIDDERWAALHMMDGRTARADW